MRRQTAPKLLWMLFAVAIFTAGCASAKGASAHSPVDVQVTLSEFKTESSVTSFTVGVPYHFIVTNKGTVNHEFMVMPPVVPGNMTMQEMDKMALGVIEGDKLPPGSTQSLDITFTKQFPKSALELACHTPGHYEAGMKLPITVQ